MVRLAKARLGRASLFLHKGSHFRRHFWSRGRIFALLTLHFCLRGHIFDAIPGEGVRFSTPLNMLQNNTYRRYF